MADGPRDQQFIESTAGDIAAELSRRGIAPNQKVLVAIEPDDWIAQARAAARPKVVANGWSDADIDQIVNDVRAEVQSSLG